MKNSAAKMRNAMSKIKASKARMKDDLDQEGEGEGEGEGDLDAAMMTA